MASEITEETYQEPQWFINTEDQKGKIRKIIHHQKSLYWLSSSSSAASCSSFSSSHKTSTTNLLKLMQRGSTSLRRLFDMEHTSLATHFEYYSGSPIIKPISLWDSDSEHEYQDHWALIKKITSIPSSAIDRESEIASKGSKGSYIDVDLARIRLPLMEDTCGPGLKDLAQNRNDKTGKCKLTRKKSYRRLPGFGLWICGRFRFLLRFKRLKVRIFAAKFR